MTLLKLAIVLGVAWLISLIGLVVFGPIRDNPSRVRRIAQTVGASAMTVTSGFAFVVVVAFMLSPVLTRLPPTRAQQNTQRYIRRLETLERWKAAHDSLHADTLTRRRGQ